MFRILIYLRVSVSNEYVKIEYIATVSGNIQSEYNNGEVIICVINRHKDSAIATDIISQQGLFDGDFEVFEVNGPDIKAENDFDETNVQTVQKESVKLKKAEQFTYKFPPHSFTMLKGKIVQ